MKDYQINFLKLATAKFGPAGEFKHSDMRKFIATITPAVHSRDWYWIFWKEYRISRATYRLPVLPKAVQPKAQVAAIASFFVKA